MSGVPITTEEKALVEKLREEVKDEITPYYDTEFNLLRWIRGHGTDLNVTAKVLSNHLKLRKYAKLDTIIEDLPDDVLTPYTPIGIVGPTGKDNRLLVIEAAGRADPNGLLKVGQIYPFVLQRCKFQEKLFREMHKVEKGSDRPATVVYVIDLEGLEMDSNLISTVTGPYRRCWEMVGANYCEWIHKFVVINAPGFMNIIWTALSALLPSAIIDKVHFMGENWREEMLELVSAERLPVHWGGTMVDEDGDPMCKSLIVIPQGPVPEELYWQPGPNDIPPAELRPISVPAGDAVIVSHFVLDAGVNFKWHLYGEQGYSFGIYFSADPKEEDIEEMDVVLPVMEYPGLTTASNLSIKTDQSGVYHFKFGNEGAWWYSVEVRFRVDFMDDTGKKVKTIPLDPNDILNE